MLSRLREPLRPLIEALGVVFAATRLPPGFWTTLGLLMALASAIVYARGADLSLLLGGILFLLSGFFDLVDGEVARRTGRVSARGAFLDSVSDRVGEVAVFLGILIGGYAPPYLVFLAAALSLLVSYARARAESVGVQLAGVGIGERPERLLVVALIGMSGFMQGALIIVCVLAGATVLQRVAVSARAASAQATGEGAAERGLADRAER